MYRTRKVDPVPPAVRTATLDELLARLAEFGALESMRSTVALQLSYFTTDEFDRRKDLRDVRGFIVARRPAFARIQAQYPVTSTKAFDMVSDGETFGVYLVWAKRFFKGFNALDERSDNRTENIRPQHIVEALMIEPPRADELAILDNVTEERLHYHVVILSSEGSITRKFWFERGGLNLKRFEVYNEDADVVTRASYFGWTTDGGAPYAHDVYVSRPIDGYELRVLFEKPGLNSELAEGSFELEPPEGVKVEQVGEQVDGPPTGGVPGGSSAR